MAEKITRQKMREILHPNNRNEKQKDRFVRDMREGRVDVERSTPRRR